MQSFTDFELILVDDGSPDGCPAICDKYSEKDSRVHVIHQRNSGVSVARNTGLEVARGKYIAFADSDDYLDKEWLQSLYSAACLNNAEMVLSGIIWVNTRNQEIGRTIRRSGIWEIKSISDCINYLIYNVLHKGNGWEVWTTLFDANIIRKNNIQFCLTCHNFAEDLGFMLEYLLYCKKIVAIPNCCYYYVQHEGSMMAKSKEIVRLDSVNEIAVQFGSRFFNVIEENCSRKVYPLLYYLVMSNQYEKIDLYSNERTYILNLKDKIKNIKWHDRWMRRLVFCKSELTKVIGKEKSRRAIINARYYANRNLLMFRIEKKMVSILNHLGR